MSSHCMGLVINQRAGLLLQKERDNHRGADFDVLFECWGAADRLSLHAVAAECEWALTMLWDNETVYMRAAVDLSPRAQQRIARSLCAGMHEATWRGHTKLDECFMRSYKIAPAQTMMQWRMRDEEQAASVAAE